MIDLMIVILLCCVRQYTVYTTVKRFIKNQKNSKILEKKEN